MGNDEVTSKIPTSKIPEYARRVHIGEVRMREIVKLPGFPALRIGRKSLVLVEAADKWLVEHAAEIK